MNEVEFLRNQLALEERHLEDVRNACEAAIAAGIQQTRLDELCRAGTRFLCVVGERAALRDRTHCELLRARLAPEDEANRGIVAELEATVESRRAVLAALGAALGQRRADALPAAGFIAACREQLAALDAPQTRRPHMVGHLLDRHYGVADWRRAALVDADSILDERERYERVRAKLPRGIELGSADRAA